MICELNEKKTETEPPAINYQHKCLYIQQWVPGFVRFLEFWIINIHHFWKVDTDSKMIKWPDEALLFVILVAAALI